MAKKLNALQKHLATISKGHEDALKAAGLDGLAEVTPAQAVQIAQITGTDAKTILNLNADAALEALNYKAPQAPATPAAKPATARSPMISEKKTSETAIRSFQR